ncbi:MAG: GNAT family N-acetyltransferase [Lactobacillus sp.]|nr:GNAT family N-acetyltransferase [Lactobacillus sp.]MDN6052830.1 GNAT family N-acetyltransferase [Lactobacillus sp.]
MPTIRLRLAQAADLPTIMTLVAQAKTQLAQAQIPQWQAGYPKLTDFQTDLAQRGLYVLEKDDHLVGAASLLLTPEPNYQQLLAGSWLANSQANYATIHRVCVDSHYSGQQLGQKLLTALLDEAKRLGFSDVRIDTHRLNLRMQYVILKSGFKLAGTVQLNHDPHILRQVYQCLFA